MRYVTGAAIAFLIALVQASSIEQFKVLGVTPNLMLVLLACWLVVRGLDDVLPMMLVAGVTFGLVGLQSPGVVLLALLPLALFGVLRELHIVHSEALLALVLVALASIAYESVIVLSVMADGGSLDVATAAREVVAPVALVNLALTLPVFVVMRLARPVDTRHRLSY
jgi:hypothetical protein